MKILVTGGAGFIGSHIVDAYIDAGHDVVVIDNLSTGKRGNLNPKARLFELDICSKEASEVFEAEKPDILNHHAAQIDVRISAEDPVFDLKVNVGGLVNLLEAGKKNGLKKVILASSGGAIYSDKAEKPSTEDSLAGPLSPYGLNKLICEHYLSMYERVCGIKWVALRYANVYGPRQNHKGEAGVVAIFIDRLLSGGVPTIFGDGKQTRDYVFVEDVVEANRLTLAEDMSGIYNVGTAVETDVNGIFSMIRELSGASCEPKYGEKNSSELLRSSVEPKRFIEKKGWRPSVRLDDGIVKTFEWFKNKIEEENI